MQTARFPRLIRYRFVKDIELKLIDAFTREGEPIKAPESVVLQEISKSDITALRKSKKPGIIVKMDSIYYYAELCDRCVIIECDAIHKCATCEHITAASDENGGCPKVRDLRKRIEEYDRILWGYQVFNAYYADVSVYVCWNYERFDKRKKTNNKEFAKLMDGLKDYYFSVD